MAHNCAAACGLCAAPAAVRPPQPSLARPRRLGLSEAYALRDEQAAVGGADAELERLYAQEAAKLSGGGGAAPAAAGGAQPEARGKSGKLSQALLEGGGGGGGKTLRSAPQTSSGVPKDPALAAAEARRLLEEAPPSPTIRVTAPARSEVVYTGVASQEAGAAAPTASVAVRYVLEDEPVKLGAQPRGGGTVSVCITVERTDVTGGWEGGRGLRIARQAQLVFDGSSPEIEKVVDASCFEELTPLSLPELAWVRCSLLPLDEYCAARSRIELAGLH